jgi:hypothetical protein
LFFFEKRNTFKKHVKKSLLLSTKPAHPTFLILFSLQPTSNQNDYLFLRAKSLLLWQYAYAHRTMSRVWDISGKRLENREKGYLWAFFRHHQQNVQSSAQANKASDHGGAPSKKVQQAFPCVPLYDYLPAFVSFLVYLCIFLCLPLCLSLPTIVVPFFACHCLYLSLPAFPDGTIFHFCVPL